MNVILTQDVDKLGKEGELVKVRPGFGRNFLLPKRLAVTASAAALKDFEEKKKQDSRREEKMMKEITKYVDVLKDTIFKIGVKAGTSGKLFGTVTTHQLAAAIKAQKNISIDRKKISIPEEVKTVGTFTANIDLHKDLNVTVNFEVVAE
ncbi:MAG TPA: 50S ribosomal protein L9 [Bacteroidetes bacterium]|nr:50S ribosomal protein L9 [Bacteroidota bacterium]